LFNKTVTLDSSTITVRYQSSPPFSPRYIQNVQLVADILWSGTSYVPSAKLGSSDLPEHGSDDIVTDTEDITPVSAHMVHSSPGDCDELDRLELLEGDESLDTPGPSDAELSLDELDDSLDVDEVLELL